MRVLLDKFKEVFFSVLPVTLVVILLHFTVARGALDTATFVRFLIGAAVIVIGLTIFLLGIDLSISPIGQMSGKVIVKSNKLWLVVVLGFGLAFIITVAEPVLIIFSQQIEGVTGGSIASNLIVYVIAIGAGVLVVTGLIRILYNVPIQKLLFGIYLIIGIMAVFVTDEFFGIAFDAAGAVTGAIIVPFVLALAVGASSLKKTKEESGSDSFGLVGFTASGAIVAILLLNLIGRQGNLTGKLPDEAVTNSIIQPFLDAFLPTAMDSFVSIVPIVFIFVGFNFIWFKLKRKPFVTMIKGLFYVFLGLILFLIGVNEGFMGAGGMLGKFLAEMDNKIWLFVVAVALGLVVILAEPAVYVLTHQVEDLTNGSVKRKMVLIALSAGMGLALLLNMIRLMVPGMKLWHILLPGYLLAIGLMFVTPKIFVGMAFDSGAVASGPLSSTFIFAFAQGVAFSDTVQGVVADAFGMIALIAFTPILTIQLLGLMFKVKSKKEGLSHEF